ncbi:E3 ubiquitin-protein ligase TRIM39-like isoform X3 [Numida meleagris]|uniref:E3 ubiquitin-protein ligase TRIM39-like isoform X3 n=1 Tax=Numida meleagris TaxID=8996 RepID=UPI000B3E00AA|nr:E3 ubiquitin-protein ligase TRIM39-like isoform X3 [Numida meleagris]
MMASGKRNADLEEWDAKIRKLTEDFEESDTELEECDTEDGELAAEIEERDRKIRKLTSDLGDVDTKLKERDRKITKLSAEIRRLTALLGDRDSKLRKLTAELAKCDATIRLFTVELGERHTKIGELTAEVGDYDRKLRKHAAELEERDLKIREHKAEIRHLTELLENRDSEVREQDILIRKLSEELEELKGREAEESDLERDELTEELDEVTEELGERDKKIGELTAELEWKIEGLSPDDEHRKKRGCLGMTFFLSFLFFPFLEERNAKIGELSAEVEKRERRIDELTAELEHYKAKARKCFEEHRRGEEKLVKVTLDPETAHPRLVLSEDQKSVRWEYTLQESPDGPERFDADPCVLGCEAFTSGRHCWVVDLAEGQYCAVGVSRESLPRKRAVSFNPDEGIWAVQQWGFKNRALTSPPTPLNLPRVPKKIRISLDYDWGEVAFFDAENQVPIFTFPPAFFGGERLRPWFWVELGSLSLPR